MLLFAGGSILPTETDDTDYIQDTPAYCADYDIMHDIDYIETEPCPPSSFDEPCDEFPFLGVWKLHLSMDAYVTYEFFTDGSLIRTNPLPSLRDNATPSVLYLRWSVVDGILFINHLSDIRVPFRFEGNELYFYVHHNPSRLDRKFVRISGETDSVVGYWRFDCHATNHICQGSAIRESGVWARWCRWLGANRYTLWEIDDNYFIEQDNYMSGAFCIQDGVLSFQHGWGRLEHQNLYRPGVVPTWARDAG